MIDRVFPYGVKLVACMTALMSAAITATANEISYFEGSRWAVSLYQPSEGEEDRPANPFCDVRTVVWKGQTINLQYVFTAPNTADLTIRLYKKGWNLPSGQTTRLILRDRMGGAELPFKAVAADTLMSEGISYADQVSQIQIGALTAMIFHRRQQATALLVQFGGNEAPWIVPPVDRYEAYSIHKALDACLKDLFQAGAGLTTGGGEDTETSPFSNQ